jgi:glutamate dehydrogenase
MDSNTVEDNTITSEYGYKTNVYEEKNEQMLKVCAYLEQLGFLPKELVKNEVNWFYR